MPDVVEDLSRAESGKVPAAPRRKARARFAILLILILLAGGGAWAYMHFRDRISTDDAQVDAHITAVAPRVSGTVLEVFINDNQSVKASDLLVRVDPRDYQVK